MSKNKFLLACLGLSLIPAAAGMLVVNLGFGVFVGLVFAGIGCIVSTALILALAVKVEPGLKYWLQEQRRQRND